jgi:hypothetical protein
MTWYKVTLSDEDISAMRQFELQNAFAVILADHDAPKDAGMFEGKSIGSHDYYFSPGAATIAILLINHYRGVQCSAPPRSSIDESVGDSGSIDIPFGPER